MKFLTIIGLLILVSCGTNKDVAEDATVEMDSETVDISENPEKVDGAYINVNGVVKDKSAGQEGGGCGFIIEADVNGAKVDLEPNELPVKYQKDNVQVVISYEYSRRTSKCQEAMPIILTEIEDK